MNGPLSAAAAIARAATPARLALALVAVLATYGLLVLIHLPVEAVLREGPCAGLDCLRPLRPDARHGGYTSADLRLYLDAVWGLRGRTLLGLAAEIPFIAAVGVSLLLAAGLASRDVPLGERTATILLALPLAYAGIDLLENALLALALGGLSPPIPILPWVTAAKFAAAVGSGALSLILGLMRVMA